VYRLFIANKNYSSWSLRPWLLMRMLELPFEEQLTPFGMAAFAGGSPTGRVPCLLDDVRAVWDSLAICEYLAERHEGVWPADPEARAWARCAACEMHAGFPVLREACTMNLGLRIRLSATPLPLRWELERIAGLWAEGLARFGGPFLAGSAFTAVDAFFAPVAFRFQTYDLDPGGEAGAYGVRLRALPPMAEWYGDALAETWRDEAHEAEARRAGTWLQDLRAPERP